MRQNQEIRRRHDREEQEAAALRAAEAAERAARQDAQARARAANAARDAAAAAHASQAVRQAWGDSELFEDAVAVLCSHPDNAPDVLHATLAKLLLILNAIEAQPEAQSKRRLNLHSAAFPNAHGALAALLALGFVYDDDAALLVLRDGYRRAALAHARGRLQGLQRARGA